MQNNNNKQIESILDDITSIMEENMISAIVKNNGVLDNNAAGIYSIMRSNQETNSNILKGLELCKDNEGNFNTSLAQILWDLSLQKADITEIEDFLEFCKDENGNINKSLADTLHLFFESGEDKEKIKSYLFG